MTPGELGQPFTGPRNTHEAWAPELTERAFLLQRLEKKTADKRRGRSMDGD